MIILSAPNSFQVVIQEDKDNIFHSNIKGTSVWEWGCMYELPALLHLHAAEEAVTKNV